MKSSLVPYLNFPGTTKDAMDFYKSALGGELTMKTYKDFGAAQSPEDEIKIMHAQLVTDDGFAIMAADIPSSMQYQPGANVSLSLSGDNNEQLTKVFNQLAAGGSITMPLEKSMWGDIFGMFTDKFGIHWMVNISGTQNA